MFTCLVSRRKQLESFLILIIQKFFFFFSFEGRTCGIWRFPGKGSTRSYSCRPTPQLTATRDLSSVCDLHHSSRERQILKPLSEARD